MTGSIAMVVGMAAHLGPPTGAGGPIAAPPSSLQRSVRLAAQPAPSRRTRARLVTTHTTEAQVGPELVSRTLAVTRRHHPHRPPATRQLAGTTATAPAPVAVPTPDQQPAYQGRGQGHEYGRVREDQ
jgi:hypothetical protein